eukprot:jgi/Hompol1/4481/HPOL_003648-RA
MSLGTGDAKYFQRGKVHELRDELVFDKRDQKQSRRRHALKKVVANMTMGNDMSPLFPDVLACMEMPMLEVKKMVYLYLITYGKNRPELASTAIGTITRDTSDQNPLIRALALRTMSNIPVDKIVEALCEPLRRALKDKDPYVCKTAAISVAKLFAYDANLARREGFIEQLKGLLNHDNPSVVANTVAALMEIAAREGDVEFQIDLSLANKLLTAIEECNEWSQIYILESIMTVVPTDPNDAELLADRVSPRLQHSNAAVVLSALRLMLYLTNFCNENATLNVFKKLGPPLVTLLHSGPEIQYVALRNILLILQRQRDFLRSDLKVFFCKYNDPIYVKLAKLEIMFRLCTESNIKYVLPELKEYAAEVDVDFVRKAVRAIGRCAIKIERASDKCIDALVELITTKVNYVVQEAIVVIKDIFRKYPNKYESIIGTLCENLDSLDEPEAKASMIWIIGHYSDRIENADELLTGFLDSFKDETTEVQLSLLTSIVKLFIKRPNVGQDLVPKVLKLATEEVDNPDLRDRGFIYWRLLSTDPVAAKTIILTDKPAISTESDNMDGALLNQLLYNVSTLASLTHRPPKMPSSLVARLVSYNTSSFSATADSPSHVKEPKVVPQAYAETDNRYQEEDLHAPRQNYGVVSVAGGNLLDLLDMGVQDEASPYEDAYRSPELQQQQQQSYGNYLAGASYSQQQDYAYASNPGVIGNVLGNPALTGSSKPASAMMAGSGNGNGNGNSSSLSNPFGGVASNSNLLIDSRSNLLMLGSTTPAPPTLSSLSGNANNPFLISSDPALASGAGKASISTQLTGTAPAPSTSSFMGGMGGLDLLGGYGSPAAGASQPAASISKRMSLVGSNYQSVTESSFGDLINTSMGSSSVAPVTPSLLAGNTPSIMPSAAPAILDPFAKTSSSLTSQKPSSNIGPIGTNVAGSLAPSGMDSFMGTMGSIGSGTNQVAGTTNLAADLYSLSLHTSYTAPKTLFMAASTGRGLEINGTFVRNRSILSCDMTLTNRALQPLTEFAILFNKNSFGLTPAEPLDIRAPLFPNQSIETSLKLKVEGLPVLANPVNSQYSYIPCI